MSSKGIALVTGAAQGIGRSIALRLADDGFDVAQGKESSKHIADVSQDESVKEMVEEVVKQHGSLDIMIANAGVAGPYGASLTQLSAEQWDKVMSINARGTFLCYKYAGLQMINQGRGGRIIGASSIAGKKALQSQSVYSASKFAVRGLTQAAALEFGPHGITVNAYAPGAIDTAMLTGGSTGPQHTEAILNRFKEMSPLNIVGTPEDIASLVSFLASKESQFITGAHKWFGDHNSRIFSAQISINGGLFFD
ncbi:NAD-binding protein [Mycena leptocephala]|nr:NAD-binding protein [Mycena leptocephala]